MVLDGREPGDKVVTDGSFHPMWWMWGAGGIVMMLFMLLFWGMVIAGLVVGIRWLVMQGRASGSDSAMQILRERYARGDISREEFEASGGTSARLDTVALCLAHLYVEPL